MHRDWDARTQVHFHSSDSHYCYYPIRIALHRNLQRPLQSATRLLQVNVRLTVGSRSHYHIYHLRKTILILPNQYRLRRKKSSRIKQAPSKQHVAPTHTATYVSSYCDISSDLILVSMRPRSTCYRFARTRHPHLLPALAVSYIENSLSKELRARTPSSPYGVLI